MKLTYQVEDKPKFGQILLFALQQLLAILAATIAVPAMVNAECAKFGAAPALSPSAALFGAGVGTLIYLLFTRFKSPVFLGSSFSFIASMTAAFAGGVSMTLGYLGLILGAVFAGLVYVILAIIVKIVGVGWINKIMPAVVIGPTVAIIGLTLSGSAVADVMNLEPEKRSSPLASPYICMFCGLLTLFVTMVCSVYGKKMMKMIPFIIGIVSGYAVASVFTLVGMANDVDALKIVDFSKFTQMQWYPDFSFVKAMFYPGTFAYGDYKSMGSYLFVIFMAYAPVAFVVFAEHIADHKNLSSIIEKDLLKEPGLHNTLLGDGIGSMAGAFFGGCPNTTYGESIGCVAISGNASIVTIFTTAVMAIIASFIAPFETFLSTIPNCVMGGVCFALYGFIAVSGLKMIQSANLEDNRNLFTVSVILIAGVGGFVLHFGTVEIKTIACALILGIITFLVLGIGSKNKEEKKE